MAQVRVKEDTFVRLHQIKKRRKEDGEPYSMDAIISEAIESLE